MDFTDQLKKYYDAKLVGPGIWYIFHLLAAQTSHGHIDKSHIINFISILWAFFPCLDCRQHLRKMFNIHSPYNIHTSGMFEYTYMVHNIVNKRLKKKEITLEEAKHLFISNEYQFNINSIGPGVWWCLHIISEHAPDMIEELLSILSISFTFKQGSESINEFIIGTYAEKYLSSQISHTIWRMHNFVNRKLNKPEMPYREIYKFFKDDKGCGDCGNGSHQEVENSKTTPTTYIAI